MNADRRILTPVTATIAGALFMGAATLGGTFSSDAPAQKTDRFATVGDQLCEGQTWPDLSEECLAWSKGEPVDGAAVRYVTLAQTDRAAGFTELIRVRHVPTN